jgi:shikimate dehydrogenase
VQRLPIIGFPLTQTPAEAVQQAALSAAGIEVQIERWERKAHRLSDAIDELRQGEVLGAMIASPHKEKAATLVDSLSDDARSAGAVNVIVNRNGRLSGHNTDVDGVRAGLTALLPSVVGKWPRQAVVLGAGGGARAVVSVLIHSGLQRIAVFNRHLHKAEALVSQFSRSARHMDLRAMPWHETIIEAELDKAGLLVNTTAIGAGDESPIPPELLPERLHLLDLVLHRPATRLMREAQDREGTVSDGQQSFLVASAATFRLLTGREAPVDVLRSALAQELGLPEEGVAVVGD